MPNNQADDGFRNNQLLGALEKASRERIEPHLEPVEFELGAVVCDAGGHLKHAYFPRGSVLSLLTVLQNGTAIETANIGREGAFGIFAAMYSRVSFNRCIVQLKGHMVRCPIELLQSEFKLIISIDGEIPQRVQFGYGLNYLIDIENAVIVDVDAFPAERALTGVAAQVKSK